MKEYIFETKIEEEEKNECEILYDERAALTSLLKSLKDHPNNQINLNEVKIRRKDAIKRYNLWWDKIVDKYDLVVYEDASRYLDFENCSIYLIK